MSNDTRGRTPAPRLRPRRTEHLDWLDEALRDALLELRPSRTGHFVARVMRSVSGRGDADGTPGSAMTGRVPERHG